MDSRFIRSQFLKYFEERGHRVVPSHSLIPPADPTLLFVNAGMVQFKEAFVGLRDLGYRRATSTQKCLRVSGKHNDLEEVGRTPRHHTFFEMLGNFSFGDYFKADAIRFGWDLLTRGYGLKPADLWVTIHPDDAEAAELWKKDIGIDPARIVEDPSNFWSMGDTGPCGPCSEIHIDRGPAFRGTSMHDPGDRFMELWNLVFMQFDRDASGVMTPLPAPSIDTGMGLERLCAVLQDVRSNYETDLFMPLIERMASVAGTRAGRDAETDVALRVIADHARATAFLIADGIYPDNEGRGYVLRRLMRRAMRFGHKLGLRGPFFTDICLHVETVMGPAWPELAASRPVIERVAGQEEERFLCTLASGLEILETAIGKVRAHGGTTLDGDTVFMLYDTHGFPPDLTRVIVAEQGLDVDMTGFEQSMEAQRERGRASWKVGEADLADLAKTAAEAGWKTDFLGYDTTAASSEVTVLHAEGEMVRSVRDGQEAWMVVTATPFYGESGGQVGDEGDCKGPAGRGRVVDAKRLGQELIVHRIRVTEGAIAVGDRVELDVDAARRDRIRRNHSATHLLHHALRSVLGPHVRQRGSLVTPQRLRFDFSHTGPVTDDEMRAIEDMAASAIIADRPVVTDVLLFDEAVARGALHFFGDKYGDTVRLVSMGDSKELCGGTHCRRTGEIGLVKIVSETGVSAGVRRLEAVTGMDVLAWLRERDRIVTEAGRLLKVEPARVCERISRMLADEKALRKELADLQVKAAASSGPSGPTTHERNGIRVLVVPADGMDAKATRELADAMREKVGSGVVLITRSEGDRLAVLIAVTRDLAGTHPAGKLLQAVVTRFGGRGGGSPGLAQGSVPDAAAASRVLDALLESLA